MKSSEKQKIVDIMKSITPAYLATCDGDHPKVRAVSPIVEDELSIWVGTRSSSRKIKQIKQNPKISLAFIQPPYAGKGERGAIVLGEAKIIQNVNEKKRLWELWPRVYSDLNLSGIYPNGPESNEFCLLRIAVNEIEWWENRHMKKYNPNKTKKKGKMGT